MTSSPLEDANLDTDDMALASLLRDDLASAPPLSEALRAEARRVASTHFGAAATGKELLPEGAVLGSYRVERVLGVGGQAVVYLARHDRLGARRVALKVPHGEVSRMLREADAISRLSHPGIVGIVDLDAEATPPYLVLEYCAGGSLADRLADGPLPEDEVLRITRAVLEALAYAHEREVVHRDLKPENILFDEEGRPRIADFGLGKIVAEQVSLSLSQHSFTGVAGTPLYMAPEQERPGGEVDGRTDLFALGKLIHCMLTGEPPRTIRPVEQVRADLRHPWSQLVFKLTESFAAARPSGAREVLAELETWGQPGLKAQASALASRLATAAMAPGRDPEHRRRAHALLQTVLANPPIALGCVLAVVGAVGMLLGVEVGFMPLVIGAGMAFVTWEQQRAAEQEAAEEARRAREEARGILRRTGAQTAAFVFAVIGLVTTFFVLMGATICMVVVYETDFLHSARAAAVVRQSGLITFVVGGFTLVGSLILYAVSRPSARSRPPARDLGDPFAPPSSPPFASHDPFATPPPPVRGVELPSRPLPPRPGPDDDALPRA